MSEPIPLDPNEGPSAWVLIEQKPDHVEEANVRVLTGTDPENPTDDILLNKREALKMCREIQDGVNDES